MLPDLSNMSDIDPEGWLEQAFLTSGRFLDLWIDDPDRFTEAQVTDVVMKCKGFVKAMQDAMEGK